MAGYSGTPLAKKLGIKPGYKLGLVNAPKGFQKELAGMPEAVKITVSRLVGPLDLILLFLTSEKNLIKEFPKVKEKLSRTGMLWVAWPKKSSGVTTDLSFDVVQKFGLAAGLVDVKICAVNDIWSGLKFVYRLKDR